MKWHILKELFNYKLPCVAVQQKQVATQKQFQL